MTTESEIVSPEENTEGNLVLATLIGICTVIELLLSASDYGLTPWPRLRMVFYEYGAFWPGLLHDWRPNFTGQSWAMFVTHGFLHGGLFHLLFNMFSLRSLGRVVIDRVGTLTFVYIFLMTMIGGAGLYGLLATSGQPMVGASGGLFGLAGSIVAWIWVGQPGTARSIRATWPILAVLIGINVVMYYGLSGAIAWQTHLGGFVLGWILGLWLDTAPEE